MKTRSIGIASALLIALSLNLSPAARADTRALTAVRALNGRPMAGHSFGRTVAPSSRMASGHAARPPTASSAVRPHRIRAAAAPAPPPPCLSKSHRKLWPHQTTYLYICLKASAATAVVDDEQVFFTAETNVDFRLFGKAILAIVNTTDKRTLGVCHESAQAGAGVCSDSDGESVVRTDTYVAYVLGLPKNNGKKLRPHSSTVAVNWVQSATITLTSDATTTHAGLPTHLTVGLEGTPDPQWGGIAVYQTKGPVEGPPAPLPLLIQVCDTSGKCVSKHASDLDCYPTAVGTLENSGNPNVPAEACSKTFIASALDAGGKRVKDSNEVTVTWEPWPVSLSIDKSTAKVGDKVTLTADINAPWLTQQELRQIGFWIREVDPVTYQNETLVGGGEVCKGATHCVQTITTGSKLGTRLYWALALNDAAPGGIPGWTGPTQVDWKANSPCSAGTSSAETAAVRPHDQSLLICLIPNKTSLSGGETATLSADPSANLPPGDSIVITNVTKGQDLSSPCSTDASGYTSCAATETYQTSKKYRYQAKIMANGQPVALSTVVVVWWQSPVDLQITVERDTLAVGMKDKVTGTFNQPLDDSGYSIVVQNVTTGKESSPCKTGTQCVFEETSNSPVQWSYVVRLRDAETGADLGASPGLPVVSFVAWTISISADHQVGHPGDTLTVKAQVNVDVANSGGFTVQIIADHGPPGICTTGTICSWPWSASSPTFDTFTAYVYGPDGNPVPGVQTSLYTIVWAGITLTADMYSAPVGTQITVKATANFTMSNSGGWRIRIVASQGQPAICTTGNICTWPWNSQSPASVSFVAYIDDPSGTAFVSSGPQITITWTHNICPNGIDECLVLNPDHGGPNSLFTATWQDETGDSCDAFDNITFSFDGAAVVTVKADANGMGSTGIQLNNATLGAHSVSIADSCGDSNSSTTYTVQ
jgi:hypothetical protein